VGMTAVLLVCHIMPLAGALVVWDRADGLQLRIRTPNAIELHLSGLVGASSHPDMEEIRIIGFFIK